jgi:hypothetical protein
VSTGGSATEAAPLHASHEQQTVVSNSGLYQIAPHSALHRRSKLMRSTRLRVPPSVPTVGNCGGKVEPIVMWFPPFT